MQTQLFQYVRASGELQDAYRVMIVWRLSSPLVFVFFFSLVCMNNFLNG